MLCLQKKWILKLLIITHQKNNSLFTALIPWQIFIENFQQNSYLKLECMTGNLLYYKCRVNIIIVGFTYNIFQYIIFHQIVGVEAACVLRRIYWKTLYNQILKIFLFEGVEANFIVFIFFYIKLIVMYDTL